MESSEQDSRDLDSSFFFLLSLGVIPREKENLFYRGRGCQKILVAGDVGGNLEELYKRVGAVNSKSGPFDCLFCTGEFFGSADVGGERLPDSLKSAPHNTHTRSPGVG